MYEIVGLTSDEISYIESIVKSKDTKSFYEKMLDMSYNELVKLLLKKYGPAKQNYFLDRECTVNNPHISRTSEGLYCHHIDEDKAIMLSNDKYAPNNPFAYQLKDRLVYCNMLEHLLLHVKIAEEPRNAEANEQELPGIGGAVNYICRLLNGIYDGKEFQRDWMKIVASKVKDHFDDYICILRHLYDVIKQNPIYSEMFPLESLYVDWDGNTVQKVKDALTDN